MSSYHTSFTYLEKNSIYDFGLVISHFEDNADVGEVDGYLSQEQIYTDSYDGSRRILYGTRWNAVANIRITVLKLDGNDFSLNECRDIYKWLTGNPQASWMDLYAGNEVKYRLLCTIQDVKPYKMDSRTVGLNIYCESLSPWAYTPLQSVSVSIDEERQIQINNQSDDLYSYVYLKTIYKNTSGNSLVIRNITTGEITEVNDLLENEIITLNPKQFITSDKPNKKFGNSFNFVWPRLKSGINELSIQGGGQVTFEYMTPVKMGDCAIDLNDISDSICDDDRLAQVEAKKVGSMLTEVLGYNISIEAEDAEECEHVQVDNKELNNMLADVLV